MKQAINTRTQEEYDALMKTATIFGKTPLAVNRWSKHGPLTCVSLEFASPMFCNIEYYERKGYEIIPYTEFAKANIVEEPDFKALYLESKDVIEKIDAALKMDRSNDGLNEVRFKIIRKYLTKHNVTPNRDAKKSN